MQKMEEKGYLILEDGTVFQGVPFGAAEETVGEVVFATAMTGYLDSRGFRKRRSPSAGLYCA